MQIAQTGDFVAPGGFGHHRKRGVNSHACMSTDCQNRRLFCPGRLEECQSRRGFEHQVRTGTDCHSCMLADCQKRDFWALAGVKDVITGEDLNVKSGQALTVIHACLQIARTGDIVALGGLKDVITGETLCDEKNPVLLERMEFPDPVIKVSHALPCMYICWATAGA